MSDIVPRKGMPDPKLGKKKFQERFLGQYQDPVFQPLSAELKKIAAAAWDAYDNGRKSPVTRKAGAGFADPDYDLAVDWIPAREAVAEAQKRHDDSKGPLRILLINASSGSEHTCPGEMSKSYRLVEIAKRIFSAAGKDEVAFQNAPVQIDAYYSTPTQHHNPLELFTTTCAWADGKLTVWESSQFVYGMKNGLAAQLGIEADKIQVVSPYIGGAFGSRGSITQRTAIIAIAAQKLNRPVKLVATRAQGFSIATYRAETRQHLKLAAVRNGKLQSLSHEGWELTSRPDNYMVAGTAATTRLYGCQNVASKVSIVHADRNTPGFMRAPAELPYLFGWRAQWTNWPSRSTWTRSNCVGSTIPGTSRSRAYLIPADL